MISTFKPIKCLQILTFLLIITLTQSVKAETNNKNLVNIYFFHSTDCSHCNAEIKFLNSIEKEYNNIKIYHYEVSKPQNNELRMKIQKIYNLKNNGVPLTIIGNTSYIGYSKEKSNITFIKTIEYYSRYGYKDQVGEYLKLKTLPTYEINKTTPSLEDFIETYGNYKLIGPLYTNNLTPTTTSLILGILSQLNLIKLITTLIIIILVSKLKENKKELVILSIYFIESFIFNINHIVSNNIYTTLIYILLLLIIILISIKYKKTKKREHIYTLLTIIMVPITSYLENKLAPTYATTFKEIIKLNNLTGITKLNYYGNYLFAILIINVLIITASQSLKIKNFKKKIS